MRFLLFKAMPLGLLVYSMNSHVTVVQQQLKNITNMVDYYIAQTNMMKYAAFMAADPSFISNPPEDNLREYLNMNFKMFTGEAGIDPWGNEYRLERLYDDEGYFYYLITCGPDGYCGNDDDLKIRINVM